MALAGLPLALVCLLGIDCLGEGDLVWVRFNSNDVISVEVRPGEAGDSVSTSLHSTAGAVDVGQATVDPGAAPAGTDHRVTVDVSDEYEEVVGRVTVHVDAGDRGAEEFELSRDSADHGYWWVELRSVGESDEERTDRFSIRLWVEEEQGAIVDDSGDAT